MSTPDPKSAPSLEKQCGETQQGTPAKGSSKEDPPNQPIAKDLPAGASAKIRAKPVSDRRQSQLTAWTAAIEDRTDLEPPHAPQQRPLEIAHFQPTTLYIQLGVLLL